MSHANKRSNGFTLVELMLAMGFVAALLLAVAMTVLQISNIYSRGLALKNINQAGLAISSEIQTDINNSQPFTLVDSGDDNTRYVNINGVGGRLCLSGYAYIWNNGYAINIKKGNLNKYNDALNTAVKFAKIADPISQYCKNRTLNIDKAKAIELLDSGQYDLAIHDVAITTTSAGTDIRTNQQLYTVKILIGTNNTAAMDFSATSSPTYNKCFLPNNIHYDSLCYINDFNIVARAGNAIK